MHFYYLVEQDTQFRNRVPALYLGRLHPVVWNPWEKKSKTMADFGDEEYKQMLCVDAAAVERAITLKPGEEWTGKLELSAVASTNCSDHLDHPGRL